MTSLNGLEIPNLAIFAPSSTDGYGGLSTAVSPLACGRVLSPGPFSRIFTLPSALPPQDKDTALKLFWKVRQDLLDSNG